MLHEEVDQSQERSIVNLLRFSGSFVDAPKRQESINQVNSATGLAADAQVGFIVEALFLQVQPELAIRLALRAGDLLLFIGQCLFYPAKGLSIASLSMIRVLYSSFAGRYALVMEAFPVFGQVERKHARKDERIILAGSNIDAIGLRQAEPLL